MANYQDFLKNILDDDGLVTNVNYNFQESPATQQYHSVAARDNPDYAQAIGDIYRWGDINRSNFNLGLDFAYNKGNKDYLEKTRDEQRAYAKQLRDEQRAYNEKQQARAWARADAKAKELRDQQLEDMKFKIALENFNKVQNTPRDIASFTPYRTNNTNINIDLDQLAQERQDLIDVGNKLFAPENLSGNSLNEIKYNALMAERQHQQDIADYNTKARDIRSNYQEELLRNAAENPYLTGLGQYFGNNRASKYLMNNDDRSYAAKMISEDPFFGITHQTKEKKARMLANFMHDYNALDTNGWNSDDYNKILAKGLAQSGYDISQMAPLVSYDENGNEKDYVFDNNTATIYEIAENDNTNMLQLVPITSIEPHTNDLSNLFKNIGYGTKIMSPRVTTPRPENFGEK